MRDAWLLHKTTGCRWRQSICSLNIDPNGCYLRRGLDHTITYDDHLNHIPSLPTSQQGPHHPHRRRGPKHFIFCTDSPRTYLTLVLHKHWWTLLKCQLFFRSMACPIWRLLELESCCGSRVLEDDTTMLTSSFFISSTWYSSHSTFTAILSYRSAGQYCCRRR